MLFIKTLTDTEKKLQNNEDLSYLEDISNSYNVSLEQIEALVSQYGVSEADLIRISQGGLSKEEYKEFAKKYNVSKEVIDKYKE